MSFFENTRKPVGLGGKIMVAMMNFGHSAMAAWGLQFLQPAPDAMVLDCGCGGGANIKTLLRLCPKGRVQGIDYSAVSVEKARKVNARAIAAGRGIFFICNEANGETAKDDKWTQIINGMTIYTDTALKAYLEQAGFCRIQSHKNKKGWLCVTARK